MEKYNDSFPLTMEQEIKIFPYTESPDIFHSNSKKNLTDFSKRLGYLVFHIFLPTSINLKNIKMKKTVW